MKPLISSGIADERVCDLSPAASTASASSAGSNSRGRRRRVVKWHRSEALTPACALTHAHFLCLLTHPLPGVIYPALERPDDGGPARAPEPKTSFSQIYAVMAEGSTPGKGQIDGEGRGHKFPKHDREPYKVHLLTIVASAGIALDPPAECRTV